MSIYVIVILEKEARIELEMTSGNMQPKQLANEGV